MKHINLICNHQSLIKIYNFNRSVQIELNKNNIYWGTTKLRNENETKRNETKRKMKKRNEIQRNETK